MFIHIYILVKMISIFEELLSFFDIGESKVVGWEKIFLKECKKNVVLLSSM